MNLNTLQQPLPSPPRSLAFQAAWSAMLLDHNDVNVATQPELGRVERGCRIAAQRRLLWQQQSQASDAADAADVRFAQPLAAAAASLSVQSPVAGGVSIAYLVMGHREFAAATIGRLLHVLWQPAHLFLLHVDARANATIVDELDARFGQLANVHVMRGADERRAVGWGAFSQVDTLLRAIATALAAAPAFDFFINLSDADVALRTDSEIVRFLATFRGRSFVSTKFPQADAMRYRSHAHMRQWPWLECDGEGFVLLNMSAVDHFGNDPRERRCCYARSGPVLYAPHGLPITRPPAPAEVGSFYHGSQWVVLARRAAAWLVRDKLATQLARHLSLTYMADETFVQTALMASPHRASVVNHNLRYIDWPHGYGDPNAYWQSVGPKHISGPMVLTPSLFGAAASSAALFARKVDADHVDGAAFVHRWDAWMAAKLIVERAQRTAAHAGATTASMADASWEAPAAPPIAAAVAAGHVAAADLSLPVGTAELTAAEATLASAPPQPAVAAPLLAEDPSLRSLYLPHTSDELDRLSDEEIASRVPRAVHFGHEDLMALQFAPPKAPTPNVAPASGVATASGVAPGVMQEPSSDTFEQLNPGDDGVVRLAEVVFADGSRCSCAAHCGRAGTLDCCPEWESPCRSRRYSP